MYFSIIFPLADLRNLHHERAGRLERPAWGQSDPQAKFARGFGEIHTRTKSGSGYPGENYYADCNNLIRYPTQYFLRPIQKLQRAIVAYPIYRRFYFDGEMSGRFELGFRLNDGSIDEVAFSEGNVKYSAEELAAQILQENVRIELLDGRKFTQPFSAAAPALRDGWILSSTKNAALKSFELEKIGKTYVGVGSPFVFIRSGRETNLQKDRQRRQLFGDENLEIFLSRSGTQKQSFDVAAIPSVASLSDETPRERLARLFYTQVRVLSYAHSFYLRQVASGKLSGPRSIEPAIQALLERLSSLEPVEGNREDELACHEMAEILRRTDINPSQLATEIDNLVKPGFFRRWFGGIFGYADRKVDIAVEAAAASATTHLLSSGP
ncbi:hypothetical protein [Pelagovum pacificum]|uniref:Uncharacterized protein n=1 Tax=Pelagovum pacificum TaxID=2588711 RepID=A0A5C5GDL9_9RHOB|nr:hypothetical protein [Pelagovum pacificum]QQA42583.1 hypothetical protein I8N54_17630 [Pelagovum pacificum]TNY31669.1 hypothetical protein FHY64_16830 [Pelagovum pacificum]